MVFFFFFQAEDGIRDLVRSRGLGDVYKRQGLLQHPSDNGPHGSRAEHLLGLALELRLGQAHGDDRGCLLYTSDAADERSRVDLGGRRILKKKNTNQPPAPASHRHPKQVHIKQTLKSRTGKIQT